MRVSTTYRTVILQMKPDKEKVMESASDMKELRLLYKQLSGVSVLIEGEIKK